MTTIISDQIQAQAQAAFDRGDVIEIPRTWIPLLPHLLFGMLPMLATMIIGIPLWFLGLYLKNQWGIDLMSVNLLVIGMMVLVTLVGLVYGVIQFFDHWIIKDPTSGKMLIGFRITINCRDAVIRLEDAGILTRKVIGIKAPEGESPHLHYGGWTPYYENPASVRLLAFVSNVTVVTRGIIAKYFGYGDLYIATAEEEDLLLFNVVNPEFWQMYIFQAKAICAARQPATATAHAQHDDHRKE